MEGEKGEKFWALQTIFFARVKVGKHGGPSIAVVIYSSLTAGMLRNSELIHKVGRTSREGLSKLSHLFQFVRNSLV